MKRWLKKATKGVKRAGRAIPFVREPYYWLRERSERAKQRGRASAKLPSIRIPGFELERHAARGEFRRLGFDQDDRARRMLSEGRYVQPRFVDHADYLPPTPDVTFLTVCTDDYAPGVEALILSMLRVYPGMTSPFILVHDGRFSPTSQDRLRGIYPYVEFVERDPDEYAIVGLGDHGNHHRIGLIGYLTLEALKLTDPEYVVILDSDLLVLGDISPLWTGDRAKAVPDAGVHPFAQVSPETGKVVVNSGVISLPRAYRGPEMVARSKEILAGLSEVTDESIVRFVDQKFWNVFLWENDVEHLPQNFNANKELVRTYFAKDLTAAKIVHFTGPKPWFELRGDTESTRAVRDNRAARRKYEISFAFWDQIYGSALLRSRLERFRGEEGPSLEALRGRSSDRPVALIGNGPSINDTDLSAFEGYEKVVFNWFPRFDQFDEFAPEHLVIASHMIYGGWHTATPALPPEYIDMLLSRSHRPTIWTSYYFKPYMETVPELADFEKRYLFFEKPFKRFLHLTGHPQFDLLKPLADASTGVLTMGVPMALHFGASRIVLAGCDSNYSSTSGSYFYASSEHASKTTRESTLLSTWEDGGAGQYAYTVTQRELDRLGVELLDATLGGALHLPKLTLDEARLLRTPSPA